ncbi:MAG TPA: S41 family peptidase [Clostridia bacterium]|nr:S41 family peptidase [Clostridia bacterium]
MSKKTFVISRKKFYAISAAVILVVFFAGYAFAYSSWGLFLSSQKPFSYLTRHNDLFRLIQVNNLIKDCYIKKPDQNLLIENAIRSLVASLEDRYSYYLDAEQYNEKKIDESGKMAGIGLSVDLNENNELIVTRVYKGAPADKAGIMKFDIITAIDGVSIEEIGVENVKDKVAGDVGTDVKITVKRGNDLKTFTITRDIVIVPMVEYRMIEEYTYIKIDRFEGESVKQFGEALDFAEENKAKGLIIDVRWNPGGDTGIYQKIADMILPPCDLIYMEKRNGKRDYYRATDADEYKNPIVVLVNGSSASASEAFSGTLQDYGYAKLVGTKTFGKGIAQTVYPLTGGAALRLTTSYYYLPKGRSIHEKGLQPDYTVELPAEITKTYMLNDQNDTQLKKALEVIKTMNPRE